MPDPTNAAVILMRSRISVLAADLRQRLGQVPLQLGEVLPFHGPDGRRHTLSTAQVMMDGIHRTYQQPVLVFDGVALEELVELADPRYPNGAQFLGVSDEALPVFRDFLNAYDTAGVAIDRRIAEQEPPEVRPINEAAARLVRQRGLQAAVEQWTAARDRPSDPDPPGF